MTLDYYCPYSDIHLYNEVLKFVESHSSFQSPFEIHHNIQEMRITVIDVVAQSQIYYLWQNVGMKDWKCDKDQLLSSKILLEGKQDNYTQQ